MPSATVLAACALFHTSKERAIPLTALRSISLSVHHISLSFYEYIKTLVLAPGSNAWQTTALSYFGYVEGTCGISSRSLSVDYEGQGCGFGRPGKSYKREQAVRVSTGSCEDSLAGTVVSTVPIPSVPMHATMATTPTVTPGNINITGDHS